MLLKKILCIIILIFVGNVYSKIFNIVDFGAKADGKTINTTAIQTAIDSLSKSGGGTLKIPSDSFLTGTFFIKDNVEIHFDDNAVLLGSLNYSDYKPTARWYSLISAKNAKNISITGKGTIDGRGGKLALIIDSLIKAKVVSDPDYNTFRQRPSENVRPLLIEIGSCQNVAIKNITLKNSSCYVQAYYSCIDLIIDSVKVESTAFWNNDGLDIVDCQKARVSNCDINSADDGICLKSREKGLCDDIIVRNCKVRSSASAVKFGTTSLSDFKNVTIENITVYDTYRSALAIETVDGGNIEHVTVSNIKATNTGNAIFIRIGHRKGQKPGYLRDVTIKNVSVEVPIGRPDAGYPMPGPAPGGTFNLIPSSITGLSDSKVEGLLLDNIEITFGGGGKTTVANIPLEQLNKVPENRGSYPEFSMFGELPATGFFVRHVNGITMKNINITVVNPDFRPALVFDDVTNLTIDSGTISPTHKDPQIILNSNVSKYTITNVKTSNGITNLIKVIGGTPDRNEQMIYQAYLHDYYFSKTSSNSIIFHAPRPEIARLRIITLDGRSSDSDELQLTQGFNLLNLNSARYKTGIYLCAISIDKKQFVTKLNCKK